MDHHFDSVGVHDGFEVKEVNVVFRAGGGPVVVGFIYYPVIGQGLGCESKGGKEC